MHDDGDFEVFPLRTSGIRPTSRPGGEKVPGHAGQESGKEAQDRSLTSTPVDGVDSTATARAEGKEFEIVRATMRITVNLRALSPTAPKDGGRREVSDAERELRGVLETLSREVIYTQNALMRELMRRDLAVLDAFRLAHGRMPRTGGPPTGWIDRKTGERVLPEWPELRLGVEDSLYRYGRKLAPKLATGLVATLARNVERKWNSERWAIAINYSRSPPWFRIGNPIPIRRQDFKISEEGIKVALFSKEAPERKGRVLLPLAICDSKQREVMARLVSGDWRAGEAAIQQDRRKPWLWYVRIAYKRKIEQREGGLYASINRGIRVFATLYVENGDRWIVEGADIAEHLRRTKAQRRSIQRTFRHASSSRRGHGRKRALKAIESLSGASERWRRTRTQTYARAWAWWLAERNVSVVYMEDFTGIRDGEPERLDGGERIWRQIQEWPYFDQGSRFASCCEEYGIIVKKTAPQYISTMFFGGCPKCKAGGPAVRDLKAWVLKCSLCGWTEHLDLVSSRNTLMRGRDPKRFDPQELAKSILVDPAEAPAKRKRRSKGK